MRLENVVWDAADPKSLGGFWAAALGAEVITDEPDLLEARLVLDAGTGAFLDLCFPRVERPSTAPPRLHLDLRGGASPDIVVQRLLSLGAEPADVGQGDVPWTVLADPEGGAFCVMPDRPGDELTTGPVACLPLDSADPERDAAFWAAVTGWQRSADVGGAPALRHPGGVGPLLVLCPEPAPTTRGPAGKNRIHLDVRRDTADRADPAEQDDDERAVVERMLALGATSLSAPGDLPWLVFADPSGNELCVLPPSPRT